MSTSSKGELSLKDRKKKGQDHIGVETAKKNGNIHFDYFLVTNSTLITEDALKYYEEQAEMIEKANSDSNAYNPYDTSYGADLDVNYDQNIN